jgi:hypothetical protein
VSQLDGAVGIKQITTDEGNLVPTRGTLHAKGPAFTVRDDPDAAETVLTLASTDGGAVATAFTPDPFSADVTTLDGDGLDLAGVIRIEITTSLALHGIEPPTVDGQPRKALLLMQPSTGRLELKHGSSSAAAGKRLACPGGASYFVLPDGNVDLLYDFVGAVWRVIP